MTRVLVADDHHLMREGIRKIIERSSGIEIAGGQKRRRTIGSSFFE